ncbi:MAG: hypothetical protein AB7R90_14370 [Reyranellaceae bacterium]
MSNPLIYAPQGDMAPDYIDEHRAWYMSRHAPTLMGVGFYSARMFDGVGTRWCNLYEIPGLDILGSPQYRQIKTNDSFRDKNIARFSNLNVTIYEQKRILDAGGQALARAPGVFGPALSFVRFDWRGDAKRLQDWLGQALALAAKGAPVRSVRLLERVGEHPELKTTYPHFAALIEWRDKGMPASGPVEAAASALGGDAANVSSESFSKRFGLVREGVFD